MAIARPRKWQPLPVILTCAALLLLFVKTNVLPSSWTNGSGLGHSNAPGYAIQVRGETSGNENGIGLYEALKPTKFLAHAPGFSVIENLYWRNDTWIVLTDQAWAVPPEKYWISYQWNTHIHPPDGKDLSTVYGIRNPALSHEAREKDMTGLSITPEEAFAMSVTAIDLDSPMMINNDNNFVNHYYHWIGELFLGIWRIWSHFAWRTGQVLPKFNTVAFPQQWAVDEAPAGSDPWDSWQDPAGANAWFTNKFFPGINVETRSTWEARARSGKLYRMPLVVLAARGAGHSGPSAAYKPFGDVLRMPVAADYLVTLRDRVLDGFSDTHLRPKKGKPIVMYLERQDSSRRLTHEDHDALVAALQALDDEGLIEFKLRSFTKEMGFQEQVATVAHTDIFVGVHGNGLTHSLWMTPGPKKAVFEMQPASCTVTDYSPLAQAAGVQHYMVHETEFCKPEDCPGRGCEKSGGINTNSIRVDPRVITDEIRRIIAR